MSDDNGASATDIITYIGVPLAVLGVLPILYNTVTTLATLSKVKRLLRKSRLAGITRGDVINKVIEVELPRFTIAPLDREDHSEQYWNTYEHPSLVRGGTWTTFNWKMHTIGLKTQRIEYSDQLRQPQAEVSFEELISYLLDIGAVPNPIGFKTLRATGLWIPTGTPLMLSPDGKEIVLKIAPLDDSDGNLSLAVHWSRNWRMRDKSSLAPYWARIKSTTLKVAPSDIEVHTPAHAVRQDTDLTLVTDPATIAPKFELETPEKLAESFHNSQSVRCHISSGGLIDAIAEDEKLNPTDHLPVNHLKISKSLDSTLGIWFASAATAVGSTGEGLLWNYTIPEDILAFSRKDTIPCGILVLLEVVPESATPDWSTKYDDQAEDRDATFKQMNERMAAVRAEGMMSPEQRMAASRARASRESQAFFDASSAKRRRQQLREQQRMLEALQSAKWDSRLIATHNLKWLQINGHLDKDCDLAAAVELLLYRLVVDGEFAGELAKMLGTWKEWVDNGGLRKTDLAMLREKLPVFAWSSLLIGIVHDAHNVIDGTLAMDLQESLRVWKQVRLG